MSCNNIVSEHCQYRLVVALDALLKERGQRELLSRLYQKGSLM